ncbi:MAG: ferrous iron transport protein A [Clostridia bacterium]|jgi:ferrous iron transport protein A|nr:ferrous iron transport protein A [Clostridia bacterium]
MPITVAPYGRELTVRKVRADEKTGKRLRELGLCEGGAITLIASSGGSVIVAVKEGRLCLDKKLAAAVIVA